MAYDEDLMYIMHTARVLLGTKEATAPTISDITTFVTGGYETPPTGFDDLGNTDIDTSITFSQDDATSETRGSLQNEKIREIITQAAVEYFDVNSLQPKDSDVMSLYYGGGTVTSGQFAAPRSTAITATEKSALLVFVDGTDVFPAYMPKVSIKRNGVMTFPKDNWVQVPLRATVLDPSTGSPTVWLSSDFTAA